MILNYSIIYPHGVFGVPENLTCYQKLGKKYNDSIFIFKF